MAGGDVESEENRLDGELGEGGLFGIRGPLFIPFGSIQHLGQKLDIPGRDQGNVDFGTTQPLSTPFIQVVFQFPWT